jgi:hypothetical protein
MPDAGVVWRQTVDAGRYVCWVERVAAYTGILMCERDGTRVLRREVTLAYQALFGPDVGDVAEWEAACIEAIDADYRERGEEVPQGGE